MRWVGGWSSTAAYAKNDVVLYLGSSYVCKSDVAAGSNPAPPSDTGHWQLVVQKGDTGAQGPTGTVTAAGDGTAAAAGVGFANEAGMGLYRSSAGVLGITTAGVAKWQINPNLIAVADNTYDIGASGANRPRSIYAGTSVVTPLGLFGDGTGAAPGIAFTSQPSLGIFRVASNQLGIAAGGFLRCWWNASGDMVLQRFGQAAAFQAIGPTFPSTGSGVEVASNGSIGFVQAYNRDGASWLPLTIAGSTLTFATSGSDRWSVNSSGHLLAATDNTVDIGASAATRPRTIYAGTSVVTPVLYGPSNVVEMRNGTNVQVLNLYGTYTDASNYERLNVTYGGGAFQINGQNAGTGTARNLNVASGANIALLATGTLYFSSGGTTRWYMGGAGHLYAGTDNTVDIGSATTVRPRNIYQAGGTFQSYNPGAGIANDGTNYERGSLSWSSNILYLQTENAGTGVARHLAAFSAGILYFASGGATRWVLQTTGHLTANTDNAYDIGAAASLRPRNIYQAGGTFQSYNPGAGIANDGTNYERLELAWSSNTAFIRTQAGGTGVSRNLALDGAALYFQIAGSSRWFFSTAADLRPVNNATNDVGFSGGKPRNVWAAGALATGIKAGPAVDGDVVDVADGMIRLDSTNNRLYCRIGGTWRYAALT